MISPCDPSTHNPLPFPDPHSAMSDDQQPSTPIHPDTVVENKKTENTRNNHNKNSNNNIVRRERPARACTARSAARLQEAAAAEAAVVAARRKQKRKERPPREESPPPEDEQCRKIVTPLVGEPPPSQLPRWSIRSMWELASILNFLHVFRSLLNIKVEFSAEELETALITPNNTLGHIHIPLLRAIPPVTRTALGQNTWITVLCRKLRDWWHWVADGEVPIVASHGAEIETYNALDPGLRIMILKALCDIRVEQEDIRNYVDDSIKHGVHLSAFRKERVGGDSHGISYWYEDDPVIGQRLYREIRKVEVKKGKGKNVQPIASSSYQWETAATNLDEFEDVSEKLSSSKNRTEALLGKKLKIDMLPEIEKELKKKERLLKKQHREALLLDNMMSVDVLAPGRSLRGRKPVSYTFDDYDRSITEAINTTKRRQPSPEATVRREGMRPDGSTNGRLRAPPRIPEDVSFSAPSPQSPDYSETDEDLNSETLDRSDRRRQRPRRYSAKDFVEAASDNDADFDSDDDIVGEVVYDDEYIKTRKDTRNLSSSSEGDEEYCWEGENNEDEEEEDDDDDFLSMSEDSGEARRFKKLPGRTRRETKLKSANELQSGLRRSKRATRNQIDYKQLELSDSETDSSKSEKSNASEKHTDASENEEFSMWSGSEDTERNDSNQEMEIDPPLEEQPEAVEEEQIQLPQKVDSPDQDEFKGVEKRRFLDLNELAPGSGFDDGPNSVMKSEDTDNF